MDYLEKPRESCGIFGIYGHPEGSTLTYFGLYALQHRGQESAGIAVSRDNNIVDHKGMGLVPDVFDMPHLEQLKGGSAIGHVRYSTTGSSILVNAQPFVVHHRKNSYAIAHNGNLVNAHILKEELCDILGLDTLYYLSLEGLLEATGIEHPQNNFWKACFDGCYPVKFDKELSKDCLESH